MDCIYVKHLHNGALFPSCFLFLRPQPPHQLDFKLWKYTAHWVSSFERVLRYAVFQNYVAYFQISIFHCFKVCTTLCNKEFWADNGRDASTEEVTCGRKQKQGIHNLEELLHSACNLAHTSNYLLNYACAAAAAATMQNNWTMQHCINKHCLEAKKSICLVDK